MGRRKIESVPTEGIKLDGYVNGVLVYRGFYSRNRKEELGVDPNHSLLVAKRNFLEGKELSSGGVVWKFPASMLRLDPLQFEPTGDKEIDKVRAERKAYYRGNWKYEYLCNLRENGVKVQKQKYVPRPYKERAPLTDEQKETIVDSLIEVCGNGGIFAPDGTYYKSSTKAAKAVGKSNSTIRRWCRDPKSDWRYKNVA